MSEKMTCYTSTHVCNTRKNINQSFNKSTEQNKLFLQNRMNIMDYSRNDNTRNLQVVTRKEFND